MSDSFFRKKAGLYYDSEDSFEWESDVGNASNEPEDSSILVGEEVDDFFRSGFFESCEEDDDKYTDGNHDGGDNEVTDSPNIMYV